MNPSKGEQTRRLILDRALTMAGEVGLEGVSIGALAEETGLSKSGLFAHFKSKEALQLEVLQEAITRFTVQVLQPVLATPRGEPRVRRLFDKYLEWIRGDDARRGCIFQKLTSEYAGRDGAVRDRLVQSQKDWRDAIMRAVQGAIDEGHFRRDLDPAVFAHEMLGIAMVFQSAWRLMREADALPRAQAIFDALLARSRSVP
ncbi:TetR/AcrR family transcriptional regulator [Solimonas flava]|uniref:TetR/AcrR family transcriptional regulator n=1 Tax=Solimonas flava TaxID=415849 RepID=UPI0004243923|nr:TetR/AcrR family transcriptional regulator [Solimonas flava]